MTFKQCPVNLIQVYLRLAILWCTGGRQSTFAFTFELLSCAVHWNVDSRLMPKQFTSWTLIIFAASRRNPERQDFGCDCLLWPRIIDLSFSVFKLMLFLTYHSKISFSSFCKSLQSSFLFSAKHVMLISLAYTCRVWFSMHCSKSFT